MAKTIEEYQQEWKKMTLQQLQSEYATLQTDLDAKQTKLQAGRRTQMPALMARHLAAVDALIAELSQT